MDSLRIAVFTLCLFSLSSGCGYESRNGARDRPLNVLFLFADDQRADTIGAWGNPQIETPHLDRLVDEGFSFRSNYNLGANGGAVCVPSRAMVNSGLAYFRIESNLEGTRTLPEYLSEQGYTTFGTGKWHNGRDSWLRSFELGKNVFFGGMSDHTEVPLVDLSPEGKWINERSGDGFSSELFADAAIEFLEEYEEEKPFYAYVAFTAPHDPRQPPVEYREQYYERALTLPENFMPQHPFNLGPWLTVRDEVLAGWPRQPDVIRDQLAEYYGLITHLDEQIGRILEALEASGHADHTLIVYAADHGLALGSHGLLGKQSVYEHSQKCPLIFSGPGISPGDSRALTYLLDLFPTLTSYLGLPAPADLDGKDLTGILLDGEESVRDSLFLAFTDQMRSVRREEFKLIVYPQLNHTQLFDLQNDPGELDNLAEEPSHQDRIQTMREEIRNWQTRLGDTQALSIEDPAPMEVDLSNVEREPDRWQPDWIVEKYFD